MSDVAALTTPESIVWYDDSEVEYQSMIDLMLDQGTLSELNSQTHPNCYLHLSDPQDVARVEHLTYICTDQSEDVGDNNWMAVDEAKAKMNALYTACMAGRTMYVVPYCMSRLPHPIRTVVSKSRTALMWSLT